MSSIRYDVPLWSRLIRAIPPLGVYALLIVGLLACLPARQWNIPIEHIAVLGLIGLWRYLWLLTHVVRAAVYEHWLYPKLRFQAEELPEAGKYPDRLYVILPTYGEKPEVSENVMKSLMGELGGLPLKSTVIINAGSEEEDEIFRRVHASSPIRDRIELVFIRQQGGKRQGMADVLYALGGQNLTEKDTVVMMDGDTILGRGIFEKCLPLFALRPKLGAVTTDNIAVTEGNWFYRKWYTLRFAMRHRMMKSQSLSSQLLVLTGRFSVFRGNLTVRDDFIACLENDRIRHWLHGEIKFVTGDDKSTWFSLLKLGCEMLYVPDAHIFCMEDSGPKPLRMSLKKMHRWFGNMLRNNGRAIRLGMGRQKAFIWLCVLDQRISMWTSLLGPLAAIWGALWLSPYYLLIYLMIVVVVRSLYLLLLIAEGHRIGFFDIPMLLYTQWVGSAVKVYTLFHLHRQKWDDHRGGGGEKREDLLTFLIPKMQILLSAVVLVLLVSIMVGVKD